MKVGSIFRIIITFILWIALFCILFFYIFIAFPEVILPKRVSVNNLLEEISANPNVEKIEDYLQDDERYEEIDATIKLKNGLQMRFNYIRREDGKLVFQDLSHINGYDIAVFIYKKKQNTCIFIGIVEDYLYPTKNLNDWLENSESIYEKLQRLPLTEVKYETSKEFFDSLHTDFVEENDTEIRKYFKWKKK